MRILHKMNRPKFGRYKATEFIKREDKLSSQMDPLGAFSKLMYVFSALLAVLSFCEFVCEKVAHVYQRFRNLYLELVFMNEIIPTYGVQLCHFCRSQQAMINFASSLNQPCFSIQ